MEKEKGKYHFVPVKEWDSWVAANQIAARRGDDKLLPEIFDDFCSNQSLTFRKECLTILQYYPCTGTTLDWAEEAIVEMISVPTSGCEEVGLGVFSWYLRRLVNENLKEADFAEYFRVLNFSIDFANQANISSSFKKISKMIIVRLRCLGESFCNDEKVPGLEKFLTSYFQSIFSKSSPIPIKKVCKEKSVVVQIGGYSYVEHEDIWHNLPQEKHSYSVEDWAKLDNLLALVVDCKYKNPLFLKMIERIKNLMSRGLIVRQDNSSFSQDADFLVVSEAVRRLKSFADHI